MTSLLDMVYPRRCLLCRKIPVLSGRQDQLRFKDLGLCPCCSEEVFRQKDPLSPYGRCSFCYQDEVRNALFRLKYEGDRDIADALAGWMVQEGRDWFLSSRFDLIIPVPLSQKRRQERGYNQAGLIARGLSVRLGVPYADLLVRTRDTMPMKQLGEDLRIKNIRDAFAFEDPGLLEKMKRFGSWRLLLVDDIITTGATLMEAKKTLTGQLPGADVLFWAFAGEEWDQTRKKQMTGQQ